MKKLLVVIALLGLITLPLLAEDVKVDFAGSRVATGFSTMNKTDTGAAAPTASTDFKVFDAKLRANATFNEDVSGVIRLSYNAGAAASTDYVYIKISNLVNKIASMNSPVNPDTTMGQFKVNVGEETYGNNVVEGALLVNSAANVTGYDRGVEFKQNDIVKAGPVGIGASFSILNGNGIAAGADSNISKAVALKVFGTFKNNLPLYLSLSGYSSKADPAGVVGESVGGFTTSIAGGTLTYRKIFELDARYDLLEGNQKFDPSKYPVFSDAKGVFRLAYGQVTDNDVVVANKMVDSYFMIDGIYNINNKWYVALRISSLTLHFDKAAPGVKDTVDTRISLGGGYRLTEKTAIKLDLTQDSVTPSTLKANGNQLNIAFTTMW
jgi:hypothetical protein